LETQLSKKQIIEFCGILISHTHNLQNAILADSEQGVHLNIYLLKKHLNKIEKIAEKLYGDTDDTNFESFVDRPGSED
jgi:hypothetical protein